ncbi:MAG TPA: hypothetical protein VGW31_08710 [Hanamia sp.]|nr:hypothetical protein [Hanamia sp.]
MKTEEIKVKLHHYIETAQEKKLKAIYTMVEDEIQDPYDYWNDKEFIDELERREKEYLEGKAKTYTLEETMERVSKAIKNVKAKK